MRISNPRRFNGDILASRKELLQWLGLNFANTAAQTGVSGTLSANIIPRGLDGRCNSIVFVLSQCDIRRGGGYLRWIDFDGRTCDAWRSRL